ncbi:hypothetical protein Cni_G10432 [Canna indica]|uniref:Uncharacterized protein n=1 Tax=Canna indica TaxID=4628 RepID=A0AAQ3K634_9LILI|nr:hypothetical protein Cni_G10432 [Canna indica]
MEAGPQHSPSPAEFRRQPGSSKTSSQLHSPRFGSQPADSPRFGSQTADSLSPRFRNRTTASLLDLYELRIIISHLTRVLTPRSTPNQPKSQRSTLYDSFELRAVTSQLDRTLRAAQTSSLLYSSPKNVKQICSCRNRSKKLKSEPENTPANSTPVAQRGRGIMPKIWNKLKRAFRRSQSG